MNVIICGHGKMGHVLEEMLEKRGVQISGIVHPGLYESACDVPGDVDAIIDFSYPGNLKGTLDRCVSSGCAAVLGTTGLSARQLEDIRSAAQHAPSVYAANYSLGVAMMKKAAALLSEAMRDEFDMEIVETHHNQKVDAPSGTAKALLKAIDPNDEFAHVFGREGITGKRGREIGIHALRGGTVAGEHSVYFFGEDETLEIRHSASSRRIFANGALRAMEFIVYQKPGLYSIEDVLGI